MSYIAVGAVCLALAGCQTSRIIHGTAPKACACNRVCMSGTATYGRCINASYRRNVADSNHVTANAVAVGAAAGMIGGAVIAAELRPYSRRRLLPPLWLLRERLLPLGLLASRSGPPPSGTRLVPSAGPMRDLDRSIRLAFALTAPGFQANAATRRMSLSTTRRRFQPVAVSGLQGTAGGLAVALREAFEAYPAVVVRLELGKVSAQPSAQPRARSTRDAFNTR